MQKISTICKKFRWSLTGALLGALVFVALYGVRVLDPTSVDWLLNNTSPDPVQHYLGWVFFRRSSVHFPYIGANYSVIYPFRTSVLFTDSLPLAALLFKALSGILPAKFQYFGWWGLACYALQGGLGQAVIARLAGLCPSSESGSRAAHWGSIAGAGVLVLFPALTIRMFAHTALAANWLILLALYIFLRSGAIKSTCSACLIWGGMGILCAGIHLYYLPMVGIVLVGCAVLALLRRRGAARALLPIAAFCGAALAELAALGAFAVNFAGYANGRLDGADLLNLLVPDLYSQWECNVYIGFGAVLALLFAAAGCVWCLVRGKGCAAFLREHRAVLAAGLVILVLDAIAACGNTVTLAGHTLGAVTIPQALMDFWSMFSSCARLLWLAGLLLAALGCAAVLRLWGGKAAAVLLAVCALAQGHSLRGELSQRAELYHDDAYYTDQTLLTDPVWQELAQSGRFAHLAFVSFDFEHDEFWDLTAYAADNGMTSNSFYLAHMDGNLACVTLPGELGTLADDTLYAFVDEDELACGDYALHYYRINGILIGTTQPLDDFGLTEESVPDIPTHTAALKNSSIINGKFAKATVTLNAGGEFSGEEWTLFPGRYRVTITGSGFDHSYIYDSYGLRNEKNYSHELTYTEISPERMVFEFTSYEMLYYWHINIHTPDETPITITALTVEKSE